MTDNKKAKCLSKEEIKTKLLDSITTDKVLERKDLNKEAEEVQDPERAAEIIKQYEDIIKMENKRNYRAFLSFKTKLLCKSLLEI